MNSNPFAEPKPAVDPEPVENAAWHALLWLVIANSAGVLLAILLLAPGLNPLLGEWTYGRWMMVHMNLELYGWTSLPMVGFLVRVYGADRGARASWCRPMLWLWSAALAAGAFSWLAGHTTGKLFLDWTGYARIFFCAALLALWAFLVLASIASRRDLPSRSAAAWAGKIAGLAVLLAVPFVLYSVSAPGGYPPVNPATGGPTGASQLESSLAIVLILLMLPFGLAPRKPARSRAIALAWIVLGAEAVLCASLGRGDVSHHQPAQYLSLAGVLAWIPLVPAYHRAFAWNPNTRLWRRAFQAWWAALVVTGWIFFLPGVLDHFKFTDGLVGHSFVAMAGFTSSLIVFVMVQMLGEGGWIFNRSRSFYLWHG
ncbi:MAG: hypothetical protein ACLGSH_17340, partial [Acidobacteriota bacterium]